ncbi:hypothetical protein PQ465_10450 [Sphingobacterium oryzagri]|uniref:Uncharacterized protein n=1 Tax=Sphingobacterium oryzagri TaxID=3025669 RepID=A0ABY7WME1_9SPHI|nr:hypothetical protein [Sphingobacterium sp. KACC 22765]WDF70776.1 hypothetical protein PQ465_10450 [Sphingobacterium sp. KACC 22765]
MNRLFKMAALACVLTIGVSACSKDEPQVEPAYQARVMVSDGQTVDLTVASPSKGNTGTIKRTADVYALRNFRQFKLDANGEATSTAADNFYFDFKENDATTSAGPVVLPNSTRSANLKVNTESGYSLYYIDKAFEQVTATDNFTLATGGSLGLQSAYAPNVIGWLNYSGSPNHAVTPVPNRTLIVFKDGVAQFKFRVNSVYSNETPEKEVAPTNYFYDSIDYQEFK